MAHKLRGALTVVGIVIGITSVVGMVSLVEGLNRSMQNQLDALESMECPEAQGFWFSRPVSPIEAGKLLKRSGRIEH